MDSYYNVNKELSKYIKKIKEAQKIVANVNTFLITNATFLRMGMNAMYATHLFLLDTRDWQKKPDKKKTWVNF